MTTLHRCLAICAVAAIAAAQGRAAAADPRAASTSREAREEAIRAIPLAQLADGDRILVCTNGVTDALAESVVAGVLASGAPLTDQARQLVDLAMAAAGDDDATALVADFTIAG